jgi:DNA repair exonuclease SbcCD ATPase subunit
MHTDDAQLERIQQLEIMLEEYKSSNRQLEQEIQNLSGSTSGSGKSWRQLSEQVERLNADKFELQQGALVLVHRSCQTINALFVQP